MFFFPSNQDMGPKIHQLTFRPKAHTMAVCCLAAISFGYFKIKILFLGFAAEEQKHFCMINRQ